MAQELAHIPLVDLSLQHDAVAEEIREGFEAVMQTTAFVDGPDVAAFEQEFAAFCGVRSCVGVGNGTDALELAFRAIGVTVGDEVLLPANSFVATAEAVVRAGATPVFADVDGDSLLLDPDDALTRVTSETRVVVPVHLFGQIAPVERLVAALAGSAVSVVEDAAQAQGATRFGNAIGSMGVAAGTSFYPGKNLGAYGDAGAVLTNDEEVARRLRAMRNHGSTATYQHEMFGMNSRLDTLQAVVLRAKLGRLARWNEQRREAARRYDELLRDVDVRRPITPEGNEPVWHLYVVRVPRRDAVLAHLRASGVGAGIHYRVPIHLQPAFAARGHGVGDFPVAEAAAGEILSLPIFPGITASQQERVVDVLREALR